MKQLLILVTFSMTLGACKSPHYLPKPMSFQYHTKGLFIECVLNLAPNVTGEIIAVNSSYIDLLPLNAEDGVISVEKRSIKSARIRVALTSNNPEMFKIWAGTIFLSSIGHGGFAIFSIPINLAVALPVANNAAKSSFDVFYPKEISWEELSKFARFPQGIPETVNRQSIQ